MAFLSQDNNPHSFKVKTNERDFLLEQDVSHYKAHAELSRQVEAINAPRAHYKRVAIIPDIVAIDMLTKYGLDIHDPNFMHDPAAKKKLYQLLQTEYAALKTTNDKIA